MSQSLRKVEMTLSFSCLRVLIATKAIVDVESTLSAQNSLVARDSKSTQKREIVLLPRTLLRRRKEEKDDEEIKVFFWLTPVR